MVLIKYKTDFDANHSGLYFLTIYKRNTTYFKPTTMSSNDEFSVCPYDSRHTIIRHRFVVEL